MDDVPQRTHRRRIVYIQKTFQRGFILKFCLIALCAMLLASLLLYLFSRDSLTAVYHYHHLALQRTGEAILPALIITNLIVLLGLLAATVFMTLFVSHKIGGPLYRLDKTLKAVGEGDLTLRVNLRQRDQLTDFASGINRMTGSLDLRVGRIKGAVTALKDRLQGEGWNPEEIRMEAESLHRTVHESFKTTPQGH